MPAPDHKTWAVETNQVVWKLLGQPNRTPAEDEEMLAAAYASLFHWSKDGATVHLQRAHWLISRVAVVLGKPAALDHARRCFELTVEGQVEDFDVAYAHEALARALAASSQATQARPHLDRARSLGAALKDPEDKKIFLADLESPPWFGLRW